MGKVQQKHTQSNYATLRKSVSFRLQNLFSLVRFYLKAMESNSDWQQTLPALLSVPVVCQLIKTRQSEPYSAIITKYISSRNRHSYAFSQTQQNRPFKIVVQEVVGSSPTSRPSYSRAIAYYHRLAQLRTQPTASRKASAKFCFDVHGALRIIAPVVSQTLLRPFPIFNFQSGPQKIFFQLRAGRARWSR
jgi:hypothetical protein